MVDFSDFDAVQQLLTEAQSAEEDMRTLAKEAHLFISKQDGQWEPEITSGNIGGKPRYTFDQTSPIVDQISGDMEQSDFDITCKPANGEASEETALLLDGMIRNIENISDAQTIFSDAARNVVTAGIDGWLVRNKHIGESFDQDLVIEPIHNFNDRVWFDMGSQFQDRRDSVYCFLLSAIPTDEFRERFDDRTPSSVSDGTNSTVYYDQVDNTIIGHVYYKKFKSRVRVKTTLGREFWEDDEDFVKVRDELEKLGETVEDTRKVQDSTVFMRKFDGNGWLADEEETPFSTIPVVPSYGNFKVIENKPTYHGVVLKLMDSQRALNFIQSRQLEEVSLAPRAKYWVTAGQAKGYTDTMATMNTNTDPVQFYNADPEAPPPTQSGGAIVNQGLQVLGGTMQQFMGSTAGVFAAGMGDNPNAQSGVAIGKLQDKGNNISIKYYKSQEKAIRRTGQLLLEAIPKVYDTERQMRIVGADGKIEMKVINQAVRDEQTGEIVFMNDLSKGKYDVICTSGPSFGSRQDQSNSAILEVASIDPSILQTGRDIFLSNIASPGMDVLAKRARQQLLQAGVIPEDEMTDEEKQQAQAAAQQPREPSAEMVLAQAEQAKADAQAQLNQIKAQKDQNELQVKAAELQLEQQRLQLETQKAELQIAEKEAGLGLKADDQQFNQFIAMQKEQSQQINDAVANLNKEANTLKTIREAMGVDSIVGPGNTEAYIDQAQIVQDAQDNVEQ